jgi:hypothetical protein
MWPGAAAHPIAARQVQIIMAAWRADAELHQSEVDGASGGMPRGSSRHDQMEDGDSSDKVAAVPEAAPSGRLSRHESTWPPGKGH